MEAVVILIKKSATFLHSAQVLQETGDFESAVSRAYYAMFNATQALLLTQNCSVSTHAGLIGKFGEYFIKTGIFPKEYGRYLSQAADKRSESDYEIYSDINETLASDVIEIATIFCNGVVQYLQENDFLDKSSA